MSSTSGFSKKVMDVAFDKISKKYPSFDKDSGQKVVDSITDAYKTFQMRRQQTDTAAVQQNNQSIFVRRTEQQTQIDFHSNKSSNKVVNEEEVCLLQQTSNISTSMESAIKSNKSDNDKVQSGHNSSNINQCTTVAISQPNEVDTFNEKSYFDSDDTFLTADEDDFESGIDSSCHISTDNKNASKDKDYGNDSSKGDVPDPNVSSVDAVVQQPKPTVDISQYLQKKSLAQGMLDLALVSANTNQLRHVLDSQRDNYYFVTSLTLIISSLILQVAVGLMLIWNNSFNVKKRREFISADRINNLSVIGIFLITLINVFISTFGGVPGRVSSGPSLTTEIDSVSDVAPITDGEIVMT